MTLYDDLGVSKNADRATIKRAYRKRAQKLHPDRPEGNAERFHQITRAYDVLYDDARRAHYDQTGQDGQEDKQGDLMRRLAALFMQLVEQHDVDRTDIVLLMRQAMQNAKQSTAASIGKAEKQISKYERAKKRLKKNGGGENLFTQMLDGQIVNARRGIEMAKAEMEKIDEMLLIVADYKYAADGGTAGTMNVFMQQAAVEMFGNFGQRR